MEGRENNWRGLCFAIFCRRIRIFIIGLSREWDWFWLLVKWGTNTVHSKYFPPVVEAGNADKTSTNEADIAAKLPDPPTAEPKDPEEPSSKKQKIESVDEDFVVVDKDRAKGVPKGEL